MSQGHLRIVKVVVIGELHRLRVLQAHDEVPNHEAGYVMSGFIGVSGEFGTVGAAEELEENGCSKEDEDHSDPSPNWFGGILHCVS